MTNLLPLKEAVDLVVIPSNVSQYYGLSTVIQLTIDNDEEIRLNSASELLYSEAFVPGTASGDIGARIIVDALQFRQLINSLDASIVELAIVNNNLIITVGKSTYTVASASVVADKELPRPAQPQGTGVEIDPVVWKTIKAGQMYAIVDSSVDQVYRSIYNGESETIVGDRTIGLFTVYDRAGLPTVCLYNRNVIGLMLKLGDSGLLYQLDTTYVVQMLTDTYNYTAEIIPESSISTDLYQPRMILDLIQDKYEVGLVVSTTQFRRVLAQAGFLGDKNATTNVVTLDADGSSLWVRGDAFKVELPGELLGSLGDLEYKYQAMFSVKFLDSVIRHCVDDTVAIHPYYRNDLLVGCVFVSGGISTILARVV